MTDLSPETELIVHFLIYYHNNTGWFVFNSTVTLTQATILRFPRKILHAATKRVFIAQEITKTHYT